MRYRYIDHTSDLGVEIYGQNLEALFANSLFAIFDNILDLNTVAIKETRKIELSGSTTEDLLMDWLRELVFIFATQFFIAKQVDQIVIKDNKLSAQISGERFDAARHKIKIEIKTPTYYMFKIDQTDKGYQATVVFDV
ncbi:MAG: archease [Candidatus Latescibacteria bacterium]|nr:archease [Candidatus Latescibacterota bacterium]